MSLRTRAARSGVAHTGVAIALASLAGYALLAIVGHALDPAQFGFFVAFWGVLFGLGSSLSTIEQEVARHAATERTSDPGPPPWAITAAAAVLAGAVAALTLLPSVSHRLYGRTDAWIGLVVVVAALGFGVQFAVRGLLMGSGDVRGYSGLVVAETFLRLLAVLAVVLLAALNLRTAALAVGLGSFAWLIWVRRAGAVLPKRGGSVALWRSATGRAASLMVGAALIASVITGFPSLVTALTGGAPGAAGGEVFAALTVSRVPLLLLSPVQALAVPFVVRAHREARTTGSAMLRKLLVRGTGGAILLGAVGAAAAWPVGPWVVRLVYGTRYDVPRAAIALLVLSAWLLAWSQLVSAAFIALTAHRRMLGMWGAAVALTVVWLLMSPLGVVATTAIGALVGPVAALACGIPMLLGVFRVATTAPQTVRFEPVTQPLSREVA